VRLNWLLVFIPVALAIHWYRANPIMVFVVLALAPRKTRFQPLVRLYWTGFPRAGFR
jgi:hypothetical protein